ncbi:MAG: hypothetical protein JST00_30845 [Deltaproteobacteria bacterium]|nr:hypothetical protein [Deltaproteobacteria bacterium]
MSRRDPFAFLAQEGAQQDVVEGLRSIGSDWETLWKKAPRGDWLLGIAVRLGVDRTSLVRAAIGCARTAVDLFDGPEARALLDVAERWARGEATSDEVACAKQSLEAAAARVNDPSADAAAQAALTVAMGIVDHDTDVLASSAAFAAQATLVSTMDCGLEMAMGWAHGKTADAVRAAVSWDEIDRCTKVA